MKDFGKHYKWYYQLEMEIFMNQKDQEMIEYCWTKFWKNILETDKLVQNSEYYKATLQDLLQKAKIFKSNRQDLKGLMSKGSREDKDEERAKVKDFIKFSMELNQALSQECIKTLTFN